MRGYKDRLTVGTARRRRRPGRVAVTGLLLTAVILSGCSSSSDSTTKGDDRAASDAQVEVVNWGMTAAPRSLDPAGGFDSASLIVNGQLLEGLTQVNEDGIVEPRLAESWEETATEVVFTLRDDVTFWDGTPLTADDVVFSLQRYRDAQAGSEMAGSLVPVSDVRATGDLEVTIDLSSPHPKLLSVLGIMGIMNRAHAEAAGDALGTPDGLVMGTGPFEVQTYSPSTGVTTVRNDDYWGPEPAVKALNFEVVTDPDSLRLAIESGEIDGTFDMPIQNAATWDRSDSIFMTYIDGPRTVMLALDTSKPPFNDVHARRAVAHLVDRNGLVDSLFSGHGRVLNESIVHPSLWSSLQDEDEIDEFYDSLPSYEFDVEKAGDELAKSATPEGFEVNVIYSTSASYLGTALQAVAQSAEEIGITFNVEGVPYAEYFEQLKATTNPATVVSVGADSPLPTSLLETVASPLDQAGNNNFANYDSPTVFDALADFRAGDEAEQVEAAKLAISTMAEDSPYVPLFSSNGALALGSKIVYGDVDYSYWAGFFTCWSCNLKAVAE